MLKSTTTRRQAAFTLVEVMMAATILVVGFMGMIQAVTIGSEMMATARRQTLATQIINHEIEKLRFSSWTTISGLPAGPTAITPIDSQFSSAITAAGLTSGTTLTLSRTTANIDTDSDGVTDLKEVTFTVTWTMVPSGFSASRTYTRKNSAYFGKYGLNLGYQRS